MSENKKMNGLVDELSAQKVYVKKKTKQSGFGVVFADAFIRGIRDLGYKSPATAIFEMTDNAAEAGASNVEVSIESSGKKISQIAIVDDGIGMIPEMIRYSVIWGGTTREGSRKGWGRYGYGLPSAAVSLSKCYTVYSKIEGSEWHAVTIDLEELAKQAETGQPEVPTAKPINPPAWIGKSTVKNDPTKIKSGTIIVLENLDKLQIMSGWKQPATFRDKLLKAFGVTYRHTLHNPAMYVDGTKVEVLDPLFLLENGLYHDVNGVKAERVETANFETTSPSGAKGTVRVRASFLPPSFQLANPGTPADSTNHKPRLKVMKENLGISICRNGRQIDVVSQPSSWTSSLMIYDRNWNIELDFDAELDEYFGIATSKQQIIVSDEMWDKLEAGGVRRLIKELRDKLKKAKSADDAASEAANNSDQNKPTPVEHALTVSKSAIPKRPTPRPTAVKAKEEDDKLKKEAKIRSKKSGRSIEEELATIAEQTERNPYKLLFQDLPDGPFYRVETLGKQAQIFINTSHRFYTEVYNSPSTSNHTRNAIQLLIGVIADAEVEATGEWADMYKRARVDWSTRLDAALKSLNPRGELDHEHEANIIDSELKAEAKAKSNAA